MHFRVLVPMKMGCEDNFIIIIILFILFYSTFCGGGE